MEDEIRVVESGTPEAEEVEGEFRADAAVQRFRIGTARPTVPEVVGVWVRIRRKERLGLSQDEVGKRLAAYLGGDGWSKQMVSAVERGKRDLSATELLAFASALECSVADLFDLADLGHQARLPSGARLSGQDIMRLVLGRFAEADAPILSRVAEEVERFVRGLQLNMQHQTEQIEKRIALIRGMGEGDRREP